MASKKQLGPLHGGLERFEKIDKGDDLDPRAEAGSAERRNLLAAFPEGVGSPKWPVGIPDGHGNVVVARVGT
ncbi:MAG: hypothetical protein EXS46_03870 [Candidatus Taylorbacteria bacterium]|nr:hypothetical protein [Candidatus Taylorbacteria bacterium]